MTNQNPWQKHVTGAKRGKTRARNSRLVLVCFSLVEKAGAASCSQSQRTLTQNRSKHELLSTLSCKPLYKGN